MPSPRALPETVERHIELDADLGEVWGVLTDPDAFAAWLGRNVELDLRPGGGGQVVDHDGARRDVLVTEVAHTDTTGRIVWHWWHDDGPLSTVEIVAVPTPAGGTLVRVTETIDTTIATLEATASRRGAAGGSRAVLHSTTIDAAWSDRLGLLRIAANRSLALVARG